MAGIYRVQHATALGGSRGAATASNVDQVEDVVQEKKRSWRVWKRGPETENMRGDLVRRSARTSLSTVPAPQPAAEGSFGEDWTRR